MNPSEVDACKNSRPLFRIAYFIAAFSVSAFLAYHTDDVEFYAVHRPQLLKNIVWVLFPLGLFSVLTVMVCSRSDTRWKTAAMVLLGICLGSGTVMLCALSGMPLSISYVVDSIR